MGRKQKQEARLREEEETAQEANRVVRNVERRQQEDEQQGHR